MKPKFLLLITLVLLAVQGWAMSVDSLKTHLTKLDSIHQWNKFERLDTPIPFDGFIHPGFSPDEYEVNGVVSTLIGVFGWCNKFLDEFLYFDISCQRTEAAVGVLTQVNLDVVAGRIRYPTEVELIDTTGVFHNLSTNMIWPDQVPQRISLLVHPTAPGIYKAWLKFSGNKVNKYVTIYCIAIDRTITVQPNTSFNDYDIALGDTVTKTYVVKGKNLSGHMMVELNDTTGMYSIDRTEYDLDEAQNGSLLKVTYSPTSEGTHNAYIRIYDSYLYHNVYKTITLSCSAKERRVSVTKEQLSFEEQPIGGSDTQTFYVYSVNLNENLTLSSNNSYFSVSPKTITPEEATHLTPVTVTYKPTSVGVHNGKLTISGGGADSVFVSLIGSCVANPTITVNPTSLDFETIEVSQEKPMTINVTGTDLTGSISVTKEETHGGQFSISRDTLNASGGSVIVTFKPTEAGSFGGCVRISGGGASPVSVTLNGSARELRVTKSSLDFGTIKKGKTETRKFTVYGGNLLGNVTLLSSKPELFEVIPETITPAEAKTGKEVTVIYKPTAGGTHSGKIIVSAEGVTNKEVAVSGKCAEIKVNKTSLNFGTIEVGKDTTLTFNVIGANITGQISLLLEETISGQFSITSPANLKLPASGGSVTVKYKPTEGGTHGGRIRISGEGADPVSVSLNGSVRELSVTKTSLDFGTIKKTDTPPKKKFTVYGKNLAGNVTLTSTNSRFTVTPSTITPAEAKAGKEVTVTYTPTAGGTHRGYIIVKSSGVTPDSVSVTGKCATISANPSSYNFGNVPVGKPVTKEITITGTNVSSSITILVEETEGGQFTINKRTLPATGGTVIVTFKPTDAKTFGAALRISGGSAEAVSVSLIGKGVTPTITRNKSTLTFTGSSITSDYVKVTGTNLDDVISLTVTGSTNFTVSPSTISISDAADGKQVKVTCNPKNASSAEAKLKISSPYASTKYVTLKYSRGSSGGGETQICAVEPDGGNEGENNEFMNGGSLEVISTATTDVNELAMNSKIYAEGLNIIIETPIEQKALLSDIAGHVREVDLQAGRNEIPVNASGVYIVRIREKTAKLMLK